MVEKIEQRFGSPEEEIAFLRRQIAEQERELLERSPEADHQELHTVAKEQLHEYGTFTPNAVLEQEHQLTPEEHSEHVAQVEAAHDPAEEIVQIATERGIHNALNVMEKAKSAHTVDEVHRKLIELIKQGVEVQDLKEGVPPWHILHMTLYAVALPEFKDKDGSEPQLSELISLMEQFYAGMQMVGQQKATEHYGIEIAVADGSDDIVFYVAVPNEYIDLFQKQVLSLYPDAEITEQKHDYNIFVDNGASLIATAEHIKHHVYPLKTKEEFESDPLAVLLNAFSKIEREGGGAAVQILIKNAPQKYFTTYETVVRRVREGMKAYDAVSRASMGGEIWAFAKDVVASAKKKDDDETFRSNDTDNNHTDKVGVDVSETTF